MGALNSEANVRTLSNHASVLPLSHLASLSPLCTLARLRSRLFVVPFVVPTYDSQDRHSPSARRPAPRPAPLRRSPGRARTGEQYCQWPGGKGGGGAKSARPDLAGAVAAARGRAMAPIPPGRAGQAE